MVLSGTDRWWSLIGMALCAGMLLTASVGPAVAQRTMTRGSDAAAPASPPAAALTIRAVAPNRLEADKTHSITISGTGFAAGMTVSFSPPGVLLTGPVAVQSGTTAQLRVQIVANASPGFRTLEIAVPTVAPGTGAVALPGAPLRARLLRAVEIVGPAAGRRAPPPAGSPPPLRAPPVVSAPPLPAPPPGDGQAPDALPETADPIPAPPPALDEPAVPGIAAPLPPGSFARVTRIVPSSGEPGGTYTLELQGVALAPGVRFNFGPDIELIGTPQLSGMGRARQTIRIRPAAAPGARRLQLAAGPQTPFIDQTARFNVTVGKMKAVVTTLPVPQIEPLDVSAFIKGRIELTAPDWKTQTGSIPPAKDPVTGAWLGSPEPVWSVDVPALREDRLFTWQEQNPGVAEWFEVRFYRQAKLLATRRIDPLSIKVGKFKGDLLPTWLRADAPLLAALITPQAAGSSATKGQAGSGVGGQAAGQLADLKVSEVATTAEEQAAGMADLYWEVAGYRKFQSGGVASSAFIGPDETGAIEPILLAAAGAPPAVSGQPAKAAPASADGGETAVEVEISARWPLATPFRPTGLACGQDIAGKLNLVNLSKQGFAGSRTWDVMQLTGEFSLAKSPWLSKPKSSKPTFMGKVVATTWSFDNLFIDWGDGTQQPFSAAFPGDAGEYQSGTQLSLGKNGRTHQYQEPGNYVVRVYQLPNDAVQSGDVEVVSASLGEQQGVYFQALGIGDQPGAAEEQFVVGKHMADKAYMLYCRHVSIAPRTDPDATGPLKLVGIEVQGFPWADPAQSPVDALAQAQKQLVPKEGSPAPAAASGGGPAGSGDLQMVAAAPSLFGISAGGEPAFSACDISLTAGAALTYIGQGSARLRWRLDGSIFHEEVFDDIGPSPPRPDNTLAQDPAAWGAAPKGVRGNLLSGPIPLDTPGKRTVSVEAEVVYSTKYPAIFEALGHALGAGGKAPDQAAAKAILLGSQSGPKIGVLTPYSQSGAGLPAVSYVHEALVQVAGIVAPPTVAANAGSLPPAASVGGALAKVAGSLAPKKAPPEFVTSEPAPYAVVGHNTELPCTFEFPVSGGRFLVGGLQSGGKANVTHQDNVFAGNGVLQLPVPGQPGKHLPLPLAFQDWTVAADGFTVEQGKLNAGKLPGGELTAAGVAYTVDKLAGTAQVNVAATLASRVAQTNILSAAAQSPSLPATTAVLSPQGDWFAEGLPLGELQLYESNFTLAPKTVALDLSVASGGAPDAACAVAGAGWMGIHLGAGATLTAYDFDLPGANTVLVDNFGIDTQGLCGRAQTGAFSAQQLRGEFRWDGIDVEAANGQFTAIYRNLRVKVPWLNVELKGAQDPLLTAGEGAGKQGPSLNLTGGPANLQHGPIVLAAHNLQLVKLEGMVPAVRSDTRFGFAGEDKVFAKDVWVKDLFYGLDGRAYFAPGVTATEIGLAGQSGAIGQATLALDDVTVQAPASGVDRLIFDFDGKVTISKALEPAKMTVRYVISEPADNFYEAAGPIAGTAEPFSVTFPKGEGTVKGKVKASYIGPPAPQAAALPPPLGWIPAAHAESGQLSFKGTVDMNMFALPMVADFALGYSGSDDFWAIKAVYDGFGPTGAPLVPPFLNIFAVGGGLGYNVSLESLKGTGLASLAYASSGGVPVFNAATLVGTPDGLTLGVRGDLSIKVAGSKPGTRIDFGAFLLSSSSNWKSGAPPLEGFIKYQAGSFDGELWGGMELFGGAVGVKASQGAAKLHFGGGDWYAHLGKDSGPRIQGHALFIKGNAYLMLSPAKMALGGGAEMSESLGDCDDVCAYVEGKAEAGLGLYTSPIKLAGNSKLSVKAGGCFEDVCAGVGGKVNAYGELPNPVMRYGFSIDLPCPAPDVGITLRILPPPGGVSPSLDWCDLNPLW